MLKNKVKMKIVLYFMDEGKIWSDYIFLDEEVFVFDIMIVWFGKFCNFFLWCRGEKGKIFLVNIDFMGFIDKVCKLDKDDSNKLDYYLWFLVYFL